MEFNRRQFWHFGGLLLLTGVLKPRRAAAQSPAAAWKVSGDYLETCNCDFLCPCATNRAAKPTKGGCIAAQGFRINQGNFNAVKLDGLNFVVVLSTPGPIGEGKWTVGLIVDERADAQQREAITGIATGKAGGPMAALVPLIANFAGVEFAPIRIENKGPMKWTLSVPGLVEQGAAGVPSPSKPGEPFYLDNTGNRANPRVALARSTGTRISVFGMKFDDQGGANNGYFAPFNWKVA